MLSVYQRTLFSFFLWEGNFLIIYLGIFFENEFFFNLTHVISFTIAQRSDDAYVEDELPDLVLDTTLRKESTSSLEAITNEGSNSSSIIGNYQI